MTAEEITKIWQNPGSWKFGMIYYAKSDPRVFVQKRALALGWTMNFARPSAIPALIGILLPPLTMAWMTARFAKANEHIFAAGFAFLLVWSILTIPFCVHFSSAERAARKSFRLESPGGTSDISRW